MKISTKLTDRDIGMLIQYKEEMFSSYLHFLFVNFETIGHRFMFGDRLRGNAFYNYAHTQSKSLVSEM